MPSISPTVITEPVGVTSTVVPSAFSIKTLPTGTFFNVPTPFVKVTHSATVNTSFNPSNIEEPTFAAMYARFQSAISMEGESFLPYLYLYRVFPPFPPVISWSSIDTEIEVLRDVVPVKANMPFTMKATSAVDTKKSLERSFVVFPIIKFPHFQYLLLYKKRSRLLYNLTS